MASAVSLNMAHVGFAMRERLQGELASVLGELVAVLVVSALLCWVDA